MNADTLNAIVAAVKRNLETHTELAPAVFIGNKNEVRIVCGSFSNGPEKDVFAQVIKKIAKEMSADFILFVSESWVLPPEYSQDFMDNRGKYPSVSDHPQRKEAVVFHYESHIECKVGLSNIIQDGEVRTISEPDFTSISEATGRFTHLLPLKSV